MRDVRVPVDDGDTDLESVAERVEVREIVAVRVEVIVAVPVLELRTDFVAIEDCVAVLEITPLLDAKGDLEGDLEPVEDRDTLLEVV